MNNQIEKNYDIIVLGIGSMGSSSCYHLSKRGYKTLGIEQFDIPHNFGSHNGQSRIIRKAYFEHPSYVPLLEGAYRNWEILQKEYGEQIYFKTGLLYFGPEDHLIIKGSRRSADQYGIEINNFTNDEQKEKYPQFKIPETFVNMLEKDAGFITPERAIIAFTKLAQNYGAKIKTNEKAVKWYKKEDSIIVQTNRSVYRCKKLVISVGAWMSELSNISDFKVTKQILAWAKPKKWEDFTLKSFPCWTYADNSTKGMFYGFPILPSSISHDGYQGLKFAHHFKGEETDPNNVDRKVSKNQEEELLEAIQKFIPKGIESIHTSKTCLYTYSKDDDFIIDHHPTNEDVIITAGFSGHGFKFTSVVGEIVTDLVEKDNSDYPIEFLKLKRFSKNSI